MSGINFYKHTIRNMKWIYVYELSFLVGSYENEMLPNQNDSLWSHIDKGYSGTQLYFRDRG